MRLTKELLTVIRRMAEDNVYIDALLGAHDALEFELAEAKTLMECGHPKACWTSRLETTAPDEVQWYCAVCAEIAKRESESYQRGVADGIESVARARTNNE